MFWLGAVFITLLRELHEYFEGCLKLPRPRQQQRNVIPRDRPQLRTLVQPERVSLLKVH